MLFVRRRIAPPSLLSRDDGRSEALLLRRLFPRPTCVGRCASDLLTTSRRSLRVFRRVGGSPASQRRKRPHGVVRVRERPLAHRVARLVVPRPAPAPERVSWTGTVPRRSARPRTQHAERPTTRVCTATTRAKKNTSRRFTTGDGGVERLMVVVPVGRSAPTPSGKQKEKKQTLITRAVVFHSKRKRRGGKRKAAAAPTSERGARADSRAPRRTRLSRSPPPSRVRRGGSNNAMGRNVCIVFFFANLFSSHVA